MKLPARPPAIDLATFEGSLAKLADAVGLVNVATEDYLPWDRFRFHTPPDGLNILQWWVATVIQRRSQQRPLPLRDVSGEPFRYALPDEVLRLADRVSTRAGGSIRMSEPVTNPATRDSYVVRSLMEESITSSQLEGAATTRKVAKEMLRSGRDPRDKSERMIWNNFQAMHFVVAHRESRLDPAMIRELHDIVTRGTLGDPADGGRIQTSSEDRVHVGSFDGDVLYLPPPADQLPERMAVLCDFANAPDGEGPWLHPVLRAITVHFMVGHDHYFVDGNGRLARALFYWSMLHHGFWLTEFVTISAILKEAPAQYARSYLFAEYESDLTYFYLHHLHVLDRAFDDLESYLGDKVRERTDLNALLRDRAKDFNHRQLSLIDLALSDPNAEFTAVSHATSHLVTVETARQDLLDLEARGLLSRITRRRQHVWRPTPKARQTLGG